MEKESQNLNDKKSDNEEESDFDFHNNESSDDTFHYAQLPVPSQDFSSDTEESNRSSSQSPFRASQPTFMQSHVINSTKTDKGKVLFQLEGSQIEASQSHCSQFYCSQTDEIAFCSQSIPVTYSQFNHPIESSACAPSYANSVLKTVRSNDIKFTPISDIFENQDEIKPIDRENRILWMIENMTKLEVSVRALYLCVRLFNKVISLIKMDKDSIDLYSVACLGLGAKFENSFAQPVSSYSESSGKFTEEDIIECEKEILIKLDFQISIPTEKFFLNYWMNIAQGDDTMGMMIAFISFCSFLDSRICTFTAEVVAASIFHIAVNSGDPELGIKPVIEVAKRVGVDKIRACESMIVESIQKVVSDENNVIRKMFSLNERKRVSEENYEVPLDLEGMQEII